jgi:hypothetical protein
MRRKGIVMVRTKVLCALLSFAAFAFGSTLAEAQSDVFDCKNPSQRLTCPVPADPNKQFICHATGSAAHPYVKLSVSRNSSHQPGVAHDPNSPADQAPGASANDVGSGTGLDCDCNPRACEGVCTGAAFGTPCNDGDACTLNGTCAGNICQPGPPSCIAGAPVDQCNVQTGACDPATGECFTTPLPPGTPCGFGFACNSSGSCAQIPHVVLNEVESSGGVPGDWVELINLAALPADVSGWKFLDNDNTHTPYVIPLGTYIPAGG